MSAFTDQISKLSLDELRALLRYKKLDFAAWVAQWPDSPLIPILQDTMRQIEIRISDIEKN
jgi:hypothetical protein